MLALLLTLACGPQASPPPAAAPEPAPPVAPQRPHVHTEHGVERPDPWYWLREREDPEVLAYIEAENAWTELATADSASFRQALYDEMLARIQEDDSGVPWQDGDFLYQLESVEGAAYQALWRVPVATPDAPVSLVFDENARAEGHDYYHLGALTVSPDQQRLAVAEDTSGREIYTVRVLELGSGEWLPDTLEGASTSLAWAADSATLFYTTMDDALRPDTLWRHGLGTPQAEDARVYVEDDERFWLYADTTRSEDYLLAISSSNVTSEIRVLDATTPEAAWQLLIPRVQGVEASVAHQGDRWLVRTNACLDEGGLQGDCALNFKLLALPLDGQGEPEELLAHRPEVLLESVDAFADHLVVLERDQGVLGLRVLDRSGEARTVDLPGGVGEVWAEANAVYDTDTYRFGYTSMVTPVTVFDWQVETGELTTRKVDPVLGDYDPATYTTTRLHATSTGGVQVPVTVVHRSDLPLDGTAPLILTGYGSYGVPYDPYFTITRLPLLDRGVVFGIAHIRGGGDLGRGWYEDGKYLHKQHTFDDFIAVTEHLVAQGLAAPDRVAIYGGSAGGMLMGAVVNQRPELYAGVVAQVPFVDVVTTMMDETIPLTVIEWEEWGDPHDKTYFDAMLAYSPYDNVAAQDYPPMLITSGLNDPRVQYWEPTKWAARLRATGTGSAPLLLKTHMGAGHAGSSGRYGYLEDKAFVWAFLLESLGVTQ